MATITEVNGYRVLRVEGDDRLATVGDFTDVIGDALSEGAGVVAIPATMIGDEFFQLRTGVAGEVLQKFVNYRNQAGDCGGCSRVGGAEQGFP